MQTFLPYPNFEKSLECLDNKRLGKQRVEAFQILNIILGNQKSNAWINHPAIKMWRDYPEALKVYYNISLLIWSNRGFNNIKLKYLLPFEHSILFPISISYPNWLKNDRFHSSHRAALLAKKYDHYKQFGWKEKPEINYYWPI